MKAELIKPTGAIQLYLYGLKLTPETKEDAQFLSYVTQDKGLRLGTSQQEGLTLELPMATGKVQLLFGKDSVVDLKNLTHQLRNILGV